MKLWIARQLPNKSVPDVARALASLPVEGLALFFAPPKGEPTDPGNLAALLAIKRQGDELGDSIRHIKRQLGAQQRLALCTAISETAPETTRGQYVPVGDLVRDGTVDVVALSEADRMNFHRLRLLRDTTLCAGSFLDARPIEEKRRAGLLSRTVLDVVQNDTCELLWLGRFPGRDGGPGRARGHRGTQTIAAAAGGSRSRVGQRRVDRRSGGLGKGCQRPGEPARRGPELRAVARWGLPAGAGLRCGHDARLRGSLPRLHQGGPRHLLRQHPLAARPHGRGDAGHQSLGSVRQARS